MTSADDDVVWLDALAGRVSPAEGTDGSSGAADEARALRASILRNVTEPLEVVPRIDAAREEQLITRARAQGLLPAGRSVRQDPGPGRAAAGWRRHFGTRGALAAATGAVLIVVVAGGLLHQSKVEVAAQRGDDHAVVRLHAPDPRALRRRISDDLGAQGVHASGYEQLGRVGLDADLPLPLSPELQQVLRRYHIPTPSDGMLTVEIAADSNP